MDTGQIERYHNLFEKIEASSATEAEYAEFELLANQEEKLRNQRVKYMIELSQIREVSLSKVMELLGLNPLARA